MSTLISCPRCGHKSHPSAPAAGQEARCPACLNTLPAPAAVAGSLLSRSRPEPVAPNRTVLAPLEAMVHYTCPRCKKSLESPVSFAGQKLNCSDCGQRLQIPQPAAPPPPPLPPINRTVLAPEEPPPPPPPVAAPPRAAPVPVVELADEEPALRLSCLECGVDVTDRARVQSCPDCSATLCSAMCFREHSRHAHPGGRRETPKEPRRQVECNRCGTSKRPHATTTISVAGWVTFAVLAVLFFPLCWVGLLITETQWHCSECGARV